MPFSTVFLIDLFLTVFLIMTDFKTDIIYVVALHKKKKLVQCLPGVGIGVPLLLVLVVPKLFVLVIYSNQYLIIFERSVRRIHYYIFTEIRRSSGTNSTKILLH